MKRRLFLAAALALPAALAFAWYLWMPAGTPAGQPPLVHLDPSNYAEFKTAFNNSASTVRVVALLSPT